MKRGIAGAMAVAVLASGTAVAQDPFEHRPDAEIANGKAQAALTAAKTRWRKAAVTRYRFTVRTSCFCPESYTKPRTYEVRNGKVVRPAGTPRTVLATVPRLHRVVQDAIDDDVAQLDVTYDSRGVPRSIARDGRTAIADDEIAHSVSSFKRLPR